jgi:hypothetical protein
MSIPVESVQQRAPSPPPPPPPTRQRVDSMIHRRLNIPSITKLRHPGAVSFCPKPTASSRLRPDAGQEAVVGVNPKRFNEKSNIIFSLSTADGARRTTCRNDETRGHQLSCCRASAAASRVQCLFNSPATRGAPPTLCTSFVLCTGTAQCTYRHTHTHARARARARTVLVVDAA